jgi:hypothetical protein
MPLGLTDVLAEQRLAEVVPLQRVQGSGADHVVELEIIKRIVENAYR